MNRRDFLRKPAAPVAAVLEQPTAGGDESPAQSEPISKFANKALPATPRSLAGLTAYTGPWGPVQAAHLLRRTTFGPTRAEINTAAGQTLTQVLDRLLTAPATPAGPVMGYTGDPDMPQGTPIVMGGSEGGWNGRSSVRAWWIGQLIKDTTIVEKMTMFWHNHFVVLIDTDAGILDSRKGTRYMSLLRKHALGNVKQLAKDVTSDPGRLQFLHGRDNAADAPNENYGRELLELFTLGKGDNLGAGNYTTYTEADVRAATRVLTGWRHTDANVNSVFTASRHDTGSKQFSSAFGNRVITNGGDQEYKTLIDMIYDRPEAAEFLVRKLYRWFVYYVIDATTEQNVIKPLAAQLKSNGYNVAPVLRTLLASEHFFDTVNIGCMIKSPFDFAVGAVRQFSVAIPAATGATLEQAYEGWRTLVHKCEEMQQFIGNPPNVAGWPAYWQTPQFYEMWINAVTLFRRKQTTNELISEYGLSYDLNNVRYYLKIDTIAWVRSLPAATASDCNLLIAELARLLVPIPLTANQLAFLKESLLTGLPDFEWTVEWQAFLAAPTDAGKRQGVETKLRVLFQQFMGLAEYHLS